MCKEVGEDEITLKGTKEEMALVRAMLNGSTWISQIGHGVESKRRYVDLPKTEDDPGIPPQWQTELGNLPAAWAPSLQDHVKPEEGMHSPAFFMAHLCGYGYTPEGYRRNVLLLQSYGFECLRSRRSDEGRYWELWYLPGIWAAKGELETFVKLPEFRKDSYPWNEQSRAVCHWLAERVSFGTLDVAVQRMAAVLD